MELNNGAHIFVPKKTAQVVTFILSAGSKKSTVGFSAGYDNTLELSRFWIAVRTSIDR